MKKRPNLEKKHHLYMTLPKSMQLPIPNLRGVLGEAYPKFPNHSTIKLMVMHKNITPNYGWLKDPPLTNGH